MKSLGSRVRNLRRQLVRDHRAGGAAVPLEVGLKALDWLSANRSRFNPFEDPQRVDALKVKALSELAFTCLVGLRIQVPAFSGQLRDIADFALDLVASNELGAVVMENQTLTAAFATIEALRQRLGGPPCDSLPAFGPLLAHSGADSMERCPFQRMDFYYSLRQSGNSLSDSAIAEVYRDTLLAALPGVPLIDDWDSYCITHVIFYLTDVGHSRPHFAAAELDAIRWLVQTLMGVSWRRKDFDLLAEFLACHHQLRGSAGTLVEGAWRRLAAEQRADGCVPGPEFSAERLRQLRGAEAREYTFSVNYHPTLAAVFAAASWHLANTVPEPPITEDGPLCSVAPTGPRRVGSPASLPVLNRAAGSVARRSARPFPAWLEPLWSAAADGLATATLHLDPFTEAAGGTQHHQSVRILVHGAQLCALVRDRGFALPAAAATTLEAAERVASDPRLPALIDSQPREIEYLLWLLRLLGPPSGADFYSHLFAHCTGPAQLLRKERTQHRRFLLSWLLSDLGWEHPLPSLAELGADLLPLRARSPLALKRGDLKNLYELAQLERALAAGGEGLPSSVQAGLQSAARQLLTIALRGRDMTVLATSLAAAALLGVPVWLQDLALSRLHRLHEHQGMPPSGLSASDGWPFLSILLALAASPATERQP